MTGVSIGWSVLNADGESLDFDNSVSGRLSTDDNDISISQYDSYSLIYYNYSYALYRIESYYVLYSSQSANEYSTSICDIYNTNYFQEGVEYTFENSIELALSNHTNNVNNSTLITRKSESVSFVANSRPVNGSCSVSPIQGVLLQDEFNFTCIGWVDTDSDNDELTYNFIYDAFLFLKTYYDENPGINTLLGNGNHTITAVILDQYSMPACVDIHVRVIDESNGQLVNAMNLPLNNFSYWLEILYANLTVNATTSQVALMTDIVNDLLSQYLELAATVSSDDNEALADVQTSVINEYIDFVSSNNVTSVAEVVTVLEVL